MSEPPAAVPRTFRCPTCAAEQAWGDVCRRCRCDLSLLHAVVAAAEEQHRQALRALAEGRPRDAAAAAQRCCELDAAPRHQRLRAVCLLLAEDWPAALRAARAAG